MTRLQYSLPAYNVRNLLRGEIHAKIMQAFTIAHDEAFWNVRMRKRGNLRTTAGLIIRIFNLDRGAWVGRKITDCIHIRMFKLLCLNCASRSKYASCRQSFHRRVFPSCMVAGLLHLHLI